MLSDSSVLITGGTGSFGKAFVKHSLEELGVARIVVFSRDELKQSEMRALFPGESRLRYFIGDIRDRDRLTRAMHGVDYVVHAAALKQVDTAEYNPFEYVMTNVVGTQHVVEASLDAGVRKVIALSTDKASSPINLYGATKLTADKLCIAANHYAAGHESRFSVVRYGNVMGSRGSVIPYFRQLASQGVALPLTDSRMTRFWITLEQAVRFVADSFSQMTGGELYVPKIPSMRLSDLAEALAPGSPTVETGLRPGEKLHEEMIAKEDARRTIELPDRYVILPSVSEWGFVPPSGARPVAEDFAYRSDTNSEWLSTAQLRNMLE